ncbi:MAG: sigma-70 family RNA polymerase sigma factor [Nitrospira sp.]
MNAKIRDRAVSTRQNAQVGKPLTFMDIEEKLLPRLRLGEEEAFGQFVTHQHARLIRIAMRYVVDQDMAEEVVQDTWVTVITRLNGFEGRSSLFGWICGILIHKAKDRGVREKRQRAFSHCESYDRYGDEPIDPSRFCPSRTWAGSCAYYPHPWDERTPEQLLLSKRIMDCMQQAIDALPVTLKQVLILRDVDGIDTKEVCTRLHVSEANLYVRLHRARERVRLAIQTTCE